MMKILVYIIGVTMLVITSISCVRTLTTETTLSSEEGSLKVDDSNLTSVVPQQRVNLVWTTYPDQPEKLNLQVSTDGGRSWQDIQTEIRNTGELSWQNSLSVSQFQLRLVSSEDAALIAALSRPIRVVHPPIAHNVSGDVAEAVLSTINLSYTDPDGDLALTCAVSMGEHLTVSHPCFCVAGQCSVKIVSEALFNGTASFTYTVTANNQISNEATATLTIIAAVHNQAPTNISLSTVSIAENAGANAVVGNLSSTDTDAGDTFTYSLVSGTGATDNASFNLSGNQLRANVSFDYETKSSYSVRVRTTDAGGLNFEKQFTISVTSVNESPTANDLTPSTGYVGLARSITLNYTDPDSDLATGCTLANVVNMTESTACACAAGVCTVGVTPTAVGAVSFDYTVLANTQTSNTAHASFSAALGISVSDMTVNEWGVATLNVNLSATSVESVSLDYATTDAGGTTTAGVDYIARSGTLTIPSGSTSGIISIPIFSDHNKQGDRNFFANLSNATGAGIISSSAKITIADEDLPAVSGVAQMELGDDSGCLVLNSGGVKCWGNNSSGQIGDGTSGTNRYYPVDVSGLSSGVSFVSVGYRFACALLTSGEVKCWGLNGYGQIGDGTSGTNRLVPTSVSGLSSGVVSIASGLYHTCALLSSGGVKCWGYNGSGQIGDNTSGTNRLVPTDVSGLSSGAIAITVAGYHSCALLSTGAVKCWGYNNSGELGDGTSGTNRLVPTDVSGLSSGVAAITAGGTTGFYTCAVLTTGAAKCWGYNFYGQLGDGTSGTNRLVPTDVSSLSSGVVAISAGSSHTCALLSTGGMRCWGRNFYGPLGNGTKTDSLVPVNVSGLSSGVTAIATGNQNSCALLADTKLKCWGYNNYGQVGDNNSEMRKVPTDIVGMSSGVSKVVVGGNETCALLTSGMVSCWSSSSPVPSTVGGLSGVMDIVVGGFHSCALLSSGGVKCWGTNNMGQLGDGTGTNSSTPVDVVGLSSGVVAIAAGVGTNYALLSTGGVKSWGDGGYGRLGNNTTTLSNVPVDVTGLTSGVSRISGGWGHACAILTTGAVKCWGYNSTGEVGDGTSGTNRLTPVQVSGLTSGVVKITSGDENNCAVLSTGVVKCWGGNGSGQVGDGTSGTNRLSPVTVASFSSASEISHGSLFGCALMNTGGVKCWGSNNYGQVGDNSSGTNRLNPTDVSNLASGVVQVSAGNYRACALLTTGGVKCWGRNDSTYSIGDPYNNLVPQYVVAP